MIPICSHLIMVASLYILSIVILSHSISLCNIPNSNPHRGITISLGFAAIGYLSISQPETVILTPPELIACSLHVRQFSKDGGSESSRFVSYCFECNREICALASYWFVYRTEQHLLSCWYW